MRENRGTTKHESPFRCSLVRGFASDRRVKSAHAAHGLGGETHLPSKPPHTLTRKGVVSSRDFHRNYHRKKATTKYESPFRCSLVRGFASDRVLQERARCAWTWKGDSSPLQTTPYVDPQRGGFFHGTFMRMRGRSNDKQALLDKPAAAPIEPISLL